MIELFLCAALALPHHPRSNFLALKEFLELKYPSYTIVYINDDEELLNRNATWTPMLLRGLRVWVLRREA